MKLQSYVCGSWHSGGARGVAMRDATTGEIIGEASSEGIDFGAVLDHARTRGGPALRAMTFHERAGLLQDAREAALGVQGGVLRALLSDGRDEGRLMDRHRWRHRYGLCICRQGGA